MTISVIPEVYGGYGMEYSPVMNSIILEELAAVDMAIAVAATLPSTFLYPILEMGTDEQKNKYIPQYCGALFKPCTVAINEPRFKFDAVSLETKAEKKGGSYIINGKKCFVPMAKDSGHLLVAAAVDGAQGLFIISRDNPGMKLGEREKNIGWCALETYPVTFENCEIPAADRLGGDKGAITLNFYRRPGPPSRPSEPDSPGPRMSTPRIR